MRNLLVHAFFDIDPDLPRQTAHADVPARIAIPEETASFRTDRGREPPAGRNQAGLIRTRAEGNRGRLAGQADVSIRTEGNWTRGNRDCASTRYPRDCARTAIRAPQTRGRPTNQPARTGVAISAPGLPAARCGPTPAAVERNPKRRRRDTRPIPSAIPCPAIRCAAGGIPGDFGPGLTSETRTHGIASFRSPRRSRQSRDTPEARQDRRHRASVCPGCGARPAPRLRSPVRAPAAESGRNGREGCAGQSDPASPLRRRPCRGRSAKIRRTAECRRRSGARAGGISHGRGFPAAAPPPDRSGRERCRSGPADTRRRRPAANRSRGRTSGSLPGRRIWVRARQGTPVRRARQRRRRPRPGHR